jgi:hypothetical protein
LHSVDGLREFSPHGVSGLRSMILGIAQHLLLGTMVQDRTNSGAGRGGGSLNDVARAKRLHLI